MRAGQKPGMLSLGASKGDDRGLIDITDESHRRESAHLVHWADSPGMVLRLPHSSLRFSRQFQVLLSLYLGSLYGLLTRYCGRIPQMVASFLGAVDLLGLFTTTCALLSV